MDNYLGTYKPVPHMIRGSICGRHGRGELPGGNDGGAALLHERHELRLAPEAEQN